MPPYKPMKVRTYESWIRQNASPGCCLLASGTKTPGTGPPINGRVMAVASLLPIPIK
jgi:hypothetical protein